MPTPKPTSIVSMIQPGGLAKLPSGVTTMSVDCQPTTAAAERSTSSTPVAVAVPLIVIDEVGPVGRHGEVGSPLGGIGCEGAPQPGWVSAGWCTRWSVFSVSIGL